MTSFSPKCLVSYLGLLYIMFIFHMVVHFVVGHPLSLFSPPFEVNCLLQYIESIIGKCFSLAIYEVEGLAWSRIHHFAFDDFLKILLQCYISTLILFSVLLYHLKKQWIKTYCTVSLFTRHINEDEDLQP
ncbi:hypothetical protein GDO78_017622 [Eleutherodactylus coqui]|uniref:Uncharacterized protein n=1 Tax=Eleutherodactylus coqui TaxID=57060 RepID=A0A8J6EK78_ELECQ|nr:hypothetical protein GDO78_017622 [Eleutherodactylus coqui]